MAVSLGTAGTEVKGTNSQLNSCRNTEVTVRASSWVVAQQLRAWRPLSKPGCEVNQGGLPPPLTFKLPCSSDWKHVLSPCSADVQYPNWLSGLIKMPPGLRSHSWKLANGISLRVRLCLRTLRFCRKTEQVVTKLKTILLWAEGRCEGGTSIPWWPSPSLDGICSPLTQAAECLVSADSSLREQSLHWGLKEATEER